LNREHIVIDECQGDHQGATQQWFHGKDPSAK
jgi:hypothetical protein